MTRGMAKLQIERPGLERGAFHQLPIEFGHRPLRNAEHPGLLGGRRRHGPVVAMQQHGNFQQGVEIFRESYMINVSMGQQDMGNLEPMLANMVH